MEYERVEGSGLALSANCNRRVSQRLFTLQPGDVILIYQSNVSRF